MLRSFTMQLSPLPLTGLALALLLVPIQPARADPIAWMYNWSRSPAEIHADAPGTGYITLTDESLKTAVGNSDIVATNLRTFSTATAANPDVFTAQPYTLSLFLQDVQSGQSTTLTFSGHIDGTLTAMNANLANTFTGVTTQSVVLGDNRYTVTIGPYSPPGIPGSFNAGSISAHASVLVAPIQNLPEPGALVLGGLGSIIVGMAGWRTRRRQRARERVGG
jgi:hypothetical protein